jgi:hypothetical protein
VHEYVGRGSGGLARNDQLFRNEALREYSGQYREEINKPAIRATKRGDASIRLIT